MGGHSNADTTSWAVSLSRDSNIAAKSCQQKKMKLQVQETTQSSSFPAIFLLEEGAPPPPRPYKEKTP